MYLKKQKPKIESHLSALFTHIETTQLLKFCENQNTHIWYLKYPIDGVDLFSPLSLNRAMSSRFPIANYQENINLKISISTAANIADGETREELFIDNTK